MLPATRGNAKECNEGKLISERWFNPRTSEVYKQHMQLLGCTPQTLELEYDAKGRWIGDKIHLIY